MKKSLLALAVLSAFASAASAQSSVTLSGIMDLGVVRVGTATGYNWLMDGAGSAFDAFTISGREDLGGGMYAFFSMNMRFRGQNGTIRSADFGTGTSLPFCVAPATPAGGTCSATPPTSVPTFWRQDWVGLGGNFGALRLGRMLMPLQEMNGNYDPWYGGYTVASTHSGGITATIRANNTIYYRSPNMGGLVIDAAIAAGEGQLQAETQNNNQWGAPQPQRPGGFGQRPIGFSLQYGAGPLKVGLAYDRNYADYKTTGLYGRYDFGVAALNFQYENGDANILSGAGPKEKVKNFSIAADIPMGPVMWKVGYLRSDSDKVGGDYTKFGFGGEYNFSKRTLAYADIGKGSGDRLSTGDKKTQMDIGLRHKF